MLEFMTSYAEEREKVEEEKLNLMQGNARSERDVFLPVSWNYEEQKIIKSFVALGEKHL